LGIEADRDPVARPGAGRLRQQARLLLRLAHRLQLRGALLHFRLLVGVVVRALVGLLRVGCGRLGLALGGRARGIRGLARGVAPGVVLRAHGGRGAEGCSHDGDREAQPFPPTDPTGLCQSPQRRTPAQIRRHAIGAAAR